MAETGDEGYDSREADGEELSDVLAGGAEVLGALPGAAVGFVVAGTPGAMIGGVVTPLVTRALKAAIGAGLTRRARDRAAGAALLIESERRRRCQAGELPRDDGFLTQEASCDRTRKSSSRVSFVRRHSPLRNGRCH
jgi:hypothetical protein